MYIEYRFKLKKIDIFEIISIGNELLSGKILNTNSSWLGSQITEMGGIVKKCVVIRDDLDDIVTTVKSSLDNNTDWIITTGGLGPTHDDKTLESISKALDCNLVINDIALKRLEERYFELFKKRKIKNYEITPSRLKMVTLPQGSIPLINFHGSAPGVLMKNKKSKIICLPGIPSEVKGIFEDHLRSKIKNSLKNYFRKEIEIWIKGINESTISKTLNNIILEYPSIYIKSHPKGIKNGVPTLLINITYTSSNESNSQLIVNKAQKMLTEEIAKEGGLVDPSLQEYHEINKKKSNIENNKNRRYPNDPIVAVGALIKNNDEILLIQRKYEPGKGKWSIPGGSVEIGEKIEEAIIREIREEVGIEVKIGEIITVVDSIIKDEQGNNEFHYIIIDFEAKSNDYSIKINSELINAKWFNINEVLNIDLVESVRSLFKKLKLFEMK